MAVQDPLLGPGVEDTENEPIGVGYEGDDLDEDERRSLSAAIAESLEQAARGLVIPASHVLAQLRARRG
jgi:hypothetical protein